MNASGYWELFLQTGLPEAYLLYSHEKKMEESHHVSDGSGACPAPNAIQ